MNISTENLIGNTPQMQKIFLMIDRISQHNIPVLISGEIGTEKHQVAKTLHQKSLRSSQPFIYKACGPAQSTKKNLLL